MTASIPLLKIVVAGDGNVGKTSLIRQYCEGRFEQSRVATIGVDFQTKLVQIKEHTIKLSIWDMAGQIHFQSVRAGFYRGSRTAALVHDITNPDSLTHLQTWYEEIIAIVPKQRFLVVGNKIDLQPVYDTAEAKQFAASIKAPYLTTSANTGEGVQKMFLGMAYLALKQ
jgi:small GTP-binding protein